MNELKCRMSKSIKNSSFFRFHLFLSAVDLFLKKSNMLCIYFHINNYAEHYSPPLNKIFVQCVEQSILRLYEFLLRWCSNLISIIAIHCNKSFFFRVLSQLNPVQLGLKFLVINLEFGIRSACCFLVVFF